jgi:hypothetical protein
MHRSSYTDEVGLKSHTPMISWPVAFVLLGTAAVGVWFGARDLQAQMSQRQERERLAVAAERAAHPILARK